MRIHSHPSTDVLSFKGNGTPCVPGPFVTASPVPDNFVSSF